MSSITALRRAWQRRGGLGGPFRTVRDDTYRSEPGATFVAAGQLFRSGPGSYIEHDQRGGDHRSGDDLSSRQPLLKAGGAYAVDEKDDCPAVDREHDVGRPGGHFCCAMDKIAAN